MVIWFTSILVNIIAAYSTLMIEIDSKTHSSQSTIAHHSNRCTYNVASLTSSAISPPQRLRLSAVSNAVSRRRGGEPIDGHTPVEGQQEVRGNP